MLSFTFALIFTILFGLCIGFLAIASIKLFKYIFPQVTYYQLQAKQRQAEMNQYIQLDQLNPNNQSQNQVEYSLIYQVLRRSNEKIERVSVKHQIEILSKLMKETFGPDVTFEIVCIVDPSDYDVFCFISSLYHDHRYITPLLKSTKGSEYLINSLINSKGDIILDSHYIADIISNIKDIDKQKAVIQFYEPRFSSRSFLYQARSVLRPILMTRVAGEQIFSNLHNIEYGSSYEILKICKQLDIEILTMAQTIGCTTISLGDAALIVLNEFITDFLYKKRYWTINS